jgi:HK97 family phage major capsid protein
MTHRFRTAAMATLSLVAAVFFLLSPAVALAATGDHHRLPLPAVETLAGLALAGRLVLAELKQKRSKLLEELEALAKAEATDQTRSDFDKKEAELKALDEDIKRAESLEALRRSAAASAAPTGQEGGGAPGTGQPGDPIEQRAAQHPVAAQPAQQRDLGWEFGAFVRSYAMAQFSLRSGAPKFITPGEAAKDLYGERHPVTENVNRAQTMSDNAAGGLTVTPTYASEVIKLFGPATIVRKRGQVVPGNADYLKGKTGASVGYVGETEQGEVTGVTFGMMSMREKDISAILPISKKLMRNTAFGVEGYCRDELVRAGAEFEDRMFLYGDGTGKKVKGYVYAIPETNRFAAANLTAPTNAQVRAELRKILKALAIANVPVEANEPAWFMNPLIKMYLEDLYQGDVKAFPTLEGPNPTLMGYPVDTTTQMTGPADAGGQIVFGAHRYAMIGDTVTMSLSMSDQASFKDASGNQVNMWAQGLMAIKLDMSHDFALRYEQAFGMLTNVKWGQ